jgi:hypothetical protein
MSSELQLCMEKLETARWNAFRELKYEVTLDNFEDMVEHYIPEIFGGRITVEMPADPFDDARVDMQYTIRISVDDDASADLMDQLVRQIHPYVQVHSRHIEGQRYSVFHVVTEEDDHYPFIDGLFIRTEKDFLKYALSNNILLGDRHARNVFPVNEFAFEASHSHTCANEYHCRAEYLWAQGNIGYIGEFYHALWKIDYCRSLWCNLHGRLLTLSITLAPLGLKPYEMLWILDFMPPVSFRHYEDGEPCDPDHLRKLRLFENVSASYAKLKSSAVAS